MAWTPSVILEKNYGRQCQQKSRSPNHWRFSNKNFNLLEAFIAAVECAKILLQASVSFKIN